MIKMSLFCIGTGSSSSCNLKSRRRKQYGSLSHSKVHQKLYAPWKSLSFCTCGRRRTTYQCKTELQPAAGIGIKKLQKEKEKKAVSELADSSTQYSKVKLEEVPFEVIEAEDILLWGCPPPKIPRLSSEVFLRELVPSIMVVNTALVPAHLKARKFVVSPSPVSELRRQCWTPPVEQQSNDDEGSMKRPSSSIISWQDWSFVSNSDFQFSSPITSKVAAGEILKPLNENCKSVPPNQETMKSCFVASTPFFDLASSHNCLFQDFTPGVTVAELTDSVSSPHKPCKPEVIVSSGSKAYSKTQSSVLDNLFNFALVSPEEFQDKYCEQENDSTLSETETPGHLFKQFHNQRWGDNMENSLNIQLFQSLPVMYTTVFDIDDDECVFCKSRSTENLKTRRRRTHSSTLAHLFNSTSSLQVYGDDCITPSISKLEVCRIEEVNDYGTGEVLEVFKSRPLISSSSKIPVKHISDQEDHSSRRHSQTAPHSPTSSDALLSFSPGESFASQLEETSINHHLSFSSHKSSEAQAKSNEDPEVNSATSNQILPLSGNNSGVALIEQDSSGDGRENFKLYPPPTPIKTSKKCSGARRLESESKMYNQDFLQSHLKISRDKKNSERSIGKQLDDYLNQNGVLELTEKCPLSPRGATINCTMQCIVTSPGTKILCDHYEVEDSKKLLREASDSVTGNTLSTVSNTAVASSKPTASEIVDITTVNTFNAGEVTNAQQIAPLLPGYSDSLPSQSPIAQLEQICKSSSVRLTLRTENTKIITHDPDDILNDGEIILKKTIPVTSSSTSTTSQDLMADRSEFSEPRKALKKNSVAKPTIKSSMKKHGNGCMSRTGGKRNVNKSGGHYKWKNRTDGDQKNCRTPSGGSPLRPKVQRAQELCKPVPQYRSSDSSSLKNETGYESSDSVDYKKKKKERRKRTLWQRMIQYFFGCSARESSYESLEKSSPDGYYGSNYKPSISLFERIIIWWRRKTHRQVVVRQDSLQLFRIQRRKWMREIHEFYEDSRTVSKNVRATDRSKASAAIFQNPRARIVNSEGCVVFRDKLDNLDILNANKTRGSAEVPPPRPVKGILKSSKLRDKQFRNSKSNRIE